MRYSADILVKFWLTQICWLSRDICRGLPAPAWTCADACSTRPRKLSIARRSAAKPHRDAVLWRREGSAVRPARLPPHTPFLLGSIAPVPVPVLIRRTMTDPCALTQAACGFLCHRVVLCP